MSTNEKIGLLTRATILSKRKVLLPGMVAMLFAMAFPQLLHATDRSRQTVRIAIIMDDIGYNLARGKRALALRNLTLAVIPEAPYAKHLAQLAFSAQREVMIHLPMSAGEDVALDEGGIHGGMDTQQVAGTLDAAFELIPFAVGLNNHMGSELTADPAMMGRVMSALQTRDVFFIDSRTTPHTVAAQTARQQGIPALGRDVFLDNDLHVLDINAQFNQLLAIARRRGYAIAIAHPHDSTLDYLEAVLPLLDEMSIELVPISALIEEETRLKMAAGHKRAKTR